MVQATRSAYRSALRVTQRHYVNFFVCSGQSPVVIDQIPALYCINFRLQRQFRIHSMCQSCIWLCPKKPHSNDRVAHGVELQFHCTNTILPQFCRKWRNVQNIMFVELAFVMLVTFFIWIDGAMYTRWGRKTCPDDAELIYSGEISTI